MKLTAAVKTKVTRDWLRCFPSLGVYRPLWLLRRAGPFVVGILLERDSGNESYRPTFHVHNLARPSTALTLTLAEPLRTPKTGAPDVIRVISHDARYMESADRMRKQVLLPLDGAISLGHVIAAYYSFVSRPTTRYPLFEYEDILIALLWCSRLEDARRALDRFSAMVAAWPENINVLSGGGGYSAWLEKCHSWFEDSGRIHATVREQVRALGITSIPTSELICSVDGQSLWGLV